MCRMNKLQGWCLVCFGVGLVVGYALESWFFCSLGGMVLILAGLARTRQR